MIKPLIFMLKKSGIIMTHDNTLIYSPAMGGIGAHDRGDTPTPLAMSDPRPRPPKTPRGQVHQGPTPLSFRETFVLFSDFFWCLRGTHVLQAVVKMGALCRSGKNACSFGASNLEECSG